MASRSIQRAQKFASEQGVDTAYGSYDQLLGDPAVDIVYVPEVTPFLAAAREHGMRTLGGLPMLIYQGALAFELWTGASAPIDVMFDAARAALRARR